MGRLQGKVAIITGAARGQGAAEARLFAAEGAKVVATDVLRADGEALAAELGAGVSFHHQDVSSEAGWDEVVAATLALHGRIDVLVNNAAIYRSAPIGEHTLADYEQLVAINQIGVFLGMRAVVAPMKDAGGGSIVNISSGAGLRSTKYMIGYAATKFAVTGMTTAASSELARWRIRVNSVHPGVIETPMIAGNPPAMNEAMVRGTPLRRMGSVDEVAAAVLFLASDEASYVTGAHLTVDGGVSA